jgi:tetratricopeptide (TPR) repeat protein
MRPARQILGAVLAFVLVCAASTPSSGAADLNTIYQSYLGNVARGNYAGALDDLKKLEQEVRTRLGPNHRDYAGVLDNLAYIYRTQAKYAEAEGFYRRSLEIWERIRGAKHPDLILTLNGLANVYRDQSKYSEAEQFYRRALAIGEASGTNRPGVAATHDGLASLYKFEGKYGEAEAHYKRALAISEALLGANHPDVATNYNNLAGLYQDEGIHLAEAEAMFKRALAIRERVFGVNHSEVADSLHNLAVVYKGQGKDAEAEGLYKRALAIFEQAFGAAHPRVADSLSALAGVYLSQGKYSEAEGTFKRALATWEIAGAGAPDARFTLEGLAFTNVQQGKYAEAEELYKRELTITEQALGANHPAIAETFNDLAYLFDLTADTRKSLAYSRKATAAVIAHASMDVASAGNSKQSGGLIEQRAGYFVRHVGNLAAAVHQNIEPEPAAGREAIETAQWAVQSSAGAAVQQMGARFATGSGALAGLVRESQDLSAARRDRDQALLAALSKPRAQQDRAATDVIREQIANLDGRLAVAAALLEKQFPEYAALSNPKPLAAEEVQRLLRGDEALAFFLVGAKESYVFALTRESFKWRTIPIGANDLSAKVAAFRHGLEVGELITSINAGMPVLFDLGLA